jgi:fructose-bisphosphate aldolase, class I
MMLNDHDSSPTPREGNMGTVAQNLDQLAKTAKELVAPAKGILAADESTGTIKKRLDAIGVENTKENRRDYRELLFRTEGSADFISGVILFDETIRQNAADGTPLVKLLTDKGVIPGIKVDKSTHDLPGSPEEKMTEGLDGLRDRLNEYRELGAKFTKWRAVITIGDGIPTDYCINVNAHALARYAALSQEAGLVPIVEPEVLMDGDHSIDRCFEVTEKTLREVFYQLGQQGVSLEGMLLKPNMVISGKDASNRAEPEEVAEKTITCFKRTVPSAVPGIVFLSGGQSDEEATVNLNAINVLAKQVNAPWELSYSYGRGLQAAPQKAWSGKKENAEAAQQAYLHRARLTSAARQGSYSPDMEKEMATA